MIVVLGALPAVILLLSVFARAEYKYTAALRGKSRCDNLIGNNWSCDSARLSNLVLLFGPSRTYVVVPDTMITVVTAGAVALVKLSAYMHAQVARMLLRDRLDNCDGARRCLRGHSRRARVAFRRIILRAERGCWSIVS